MNPNWPKTVAEAVDRLLNELTEENIEKIRRMKKDELIGLHFGMGMWVRNNFGLWQGNEELLLDCGKGRQIHTDDASGVILDALWKRLQAEHLEK